jgi:hypothetical protein
LQWEGINLINLAMGRNQSYKPSNGKESILQTLQWEGINLTNLAMGRNQSYKPCNGKESILQTLQMVLLCFFLFFVDVNIIYIYSLLLFVYACS